jgi:hypothetical protein
MNTNIVTQRPAMADAPPHVLARIPAPAGRSVCSLQLRALLTIDKQCLLTCQSRLHRVSAMRGQRKLKGCPRAGIGRRPYPAAMGLDD